MFPLLKYFSITSLVAIAMTTLLIAGLHHLAERDQLLDLGESNHVALTQSFANSLLPSFRRLVDSTKGLEGEALSSHPQIADMRPRVVDAMQYTQVIKVKLYDLAGRTIFSTDASQIGRNYADNPGFQSALRGLPMSELTHRDRFSAFDREIVDRDVLSSYVALRSSPNAPIEGVLEVYSDLTEWVGHINQQARQVAMATVVALLLLYGVLFFIVRRADRLIRSQYDQLRRSESELTIAATVFESQEPMMVTDAQARIIRVNKAFVGITGFSLDELRGGEIGLIGAPRHDESFFRTIWDQVAITGGWHGEMWGQRKAGEEFPTWFTLTAVRDTHRMVTNYVVTLTDMTERARAEQQIRALAFYDQLTGLANRTLLRERLLHAMSMGARSNRHGALMFLDLDHFKKINDTLGHEAGDQLLKEIARRLQASVRLCDTVCRWGGDEFIVMLEGLDSSAEAAGVQLHEIGGKILSDLNQPFNLGDDSCKTTPSIGAVLFFGQEQSIDMLFKKADDAMYESKRQGRNRLSVFGEDALPG